MSHRIDHRSLLSGKRYHLCPLCFAVKWIFCFIFWKLTGFFVNKVVNSKFQQTFTDKMKNWNINRQIDFNQFGGLWDFAFFHFNHPHLMWWDYNKNLVVVKLVCKNSIFNSLVAVSVTFRIPPMLSIPTTPDSFKMI